MPERLSVALDGTPLAGPIGGIRRFTDQLLQALRAEFPDDNYLALSDQFAPVPAGLERRWWAYGLNKALERTGAQLFHGTDFAVPYLTRRPSVMTVHDLSPWRETNAASARVRTRAAWLMRLRIPTYIHTPTEMIREEVIEKFRWPEDRIVAIPHAAAEHFRPTPMASEPYFLYLGTLEPRKNLEVLHEAIDILWREGLRIPLRLAGHRRDGYKEPAHEAIQYLGPQEEADLPAMLSNAKAVLYPSRYEGFGLPILEAMQCGAPVIASNIGVHREVGAQVARYASPSDSQQWARQMRSTFENPPCAEQLINHASKFTWKKSAIAFHELYLRCLGKQAL